MQQRPQRHAGTGGLNIVAGQGMGIGFESVPLLPQIGEQGDIAGDLELFQHRPRLLFIHGDACLDQAQTQIMVGG